MTALFSVTVGRTQVVMIVPGRPWVHPLRSARDEG
jgi:hypothetical protein